MRGSGSATRRPLSSSIRWKLSLTTANMSQTTTSSFPRTAVDEDEIRADGRDGVKEEKSNPSHDQIITAPPRSH